MQDGSTSFENLQTAYSLGGREIVTFIQYGYFLDVDIEIEGMHKIFLKIIFETYEIINLRNFIKYRRIFGYH